MTVPAVAFTAPEILIDGQSMPETWLGSLKSIRTNTELGLVGRATLTFFDVGYTLAQATIFTLGTTVQMKIDNHVVFGGVVTGSALDHGADTLPRLVITADDVPNGISAEDHAAGLASSLANLARHVER